MIAFLSQHIETGVRGFASILLKVFPFLPASIETNPEPVSYTHLTLPTKA